MKKVLFLFALYAYINANAQDVIVIKDGTIIKSKVLEVNQNDVKYKKTSNLNGPTYTVNKSELISINFENGDKEVFDKQSKLDKETATGNSNSSEPLYIKKSPDANNAEIVELYNHDIYPTKKIGKSNDAAKACYMVWWINPSSTMSNGDVEIKLTREEKYINELEGCTLSGHHGAGISPIFVYHINIKNKTDRTIYIDKGNCFRIIDDGSAFNYFDMSEQTTVSQGSGSGISIGLGSIAGALGIGGLIGQLAGSTAIGGGSSNSVSTTYIQQRVISIPPHSNRNLTNFKYLEDIPKIVEHAEYFATKTSRNTPKRGVVKRGEVLTYNENNSPWKRKYIITYSFDNTFQTFSTLQAELYLHQMIGTKYWLDYLTMKKYHSGRFIDGWNEYTIMEWDFLEK